MTRTRIATVLVCIAIAAALAGCLEGSGRDEQASTSPPAGTGGTTATPDGQAGSAWVRVYVENSGTRDAEFRIRLNGQSPTTTAVPYTGSQPNVKTAFEGNVDGRTLTLEVEETASGATHTAEFALDDESWIVVNVYENGTLDAWEANGEPVFD